MPSSRPDRPAEPVDRLPADRAALQRLRRERFQAWTDSLCAPGATADEARQRQEAVHAVDAALADPSLVPPLRRRAGMLALIAAGVLGTLAAVMELPRAPFSLEVDAGTAALSLAHAGEAGPMPLGAAVRVEGHAAVDSAQPALRDRPPAGAGSLGLRAASLALQRLRWSDDSVLRFEAAGDALRLTLEPARPGVVAEFETAGDTEIDLGRGDGPRHIDVGPGEWLAVSAGVGATAAASAPGRRPAPVVLTLDRPAGQRYRWDGLRPTALGFVQRQPAGQGEVVYGSSLRKAHLRLPASDSERDLAAGDRLDLQGLQLERCEVEVSETGEAVTLRLSGSASAIRVAVGGFEQSQKPSLLEFIAHNHKVALFWSAAVFLWGAKSWVQKLFGAS